MSIKKEISSLQGSLLMSQGFRVPCRAGGFNRTHVQGRTKVVGTEQNLIKPL